MKWTDFNYHGESPEDAFETLSTQLFERNMRRTYSRQIVKHRVVNGDGGDGGVEAYVELANGDIIGVQAKWFREPLKGKQINQIEDSIATAHEFRKLKEYIISIPRNIGSLKYGRGKKGRARRSLPIVRIN